MSLSQLMVAASAVASCLLGLAFAALCRSCTHKKVVRLRSVKQWCAVAQGLASKLRMHLLQRPGLCGQGTVRRAASTSTLRTVTMIVSWHCMHTCYTA